MKGTTLSCCHLLRSHVRIEWEGHSCRGTPARHAHLQALPIVAGHRACAAIELLPARAAEVKDGVLLSDHGAELHADHLTDSGGVGEVHFIATSTKTNRRGRHNLELGGFD